MNKTLNQLQYEFYAKWDVMHEMGTSHKKMLAFSAKWSDIVTAIGAYFGLRRNFANGIPFSKEQWNQELPERFWDCI